MHVSDFLEDVFFLEESFFKDCLFPSRGSFSLLLDGEEEDGVSVLINLPVVASRVECLALGASVILHEREDAPK